MAGWNEEGQRDKGAKAPDVPGVPLWLQWALALAVLGLGAWFGWVMF